MTIEINKFQEYTVCCDNCSAFLDTDVYVDMGSKKEAWEQAKAQGWKIEHVQGDWLHFCPECSQS